jgi:hypothetical protein
MERSAIRDKPIHIGRPPDFAALHPGYESLTLPNKKPAVPKTAGLSHARIKLLTSTRTMIETAL